MTFTLRILFITLLFCFLSIHSSFGQNENDSIPLQESMTISLLTYSPLPEIHFAFGHSAIRVQDPSKRLDVIYNYGIFDFNEPNFVWKFLRGKLQYQLGKESTQRVFRYYRARGERQIWEKPLMLSPEEEQKIYQFLETNYLPENRKYYYDFFFDNCATRIRDIVETELGGAVEYKENLETGMTMRELLDVHVESRPWGDFGMDLLLGLTADKTATYREEMFLPAYLSQNLDEGVMIKRSGDNVAKELFGNRKLVVDGENYMNEPGWFSPFVVFGLLCLLLMILTLVYTHNYFLAIVDGILLFLLGFVGAFLLFMWFGTDHQATQWNLNILWANPLYLFFFIPVIRMKERGMKIAYGLAFVTGILILLGWGFRFPQHYHTGVLPIVLMMLVRSGSAYLYLKKNKA